jgi:hypothetical protein
MPHVSTTGDVPQAVRWRNVRDNPAHGGKGEGRLAGRQMRICLNKDTSDVKKDFERWQNKSFTGLGASRQRWPEGPDAGIECRSTWRFNAVNFQRRAMEQYIHQLPNGWSVGVQDAEPGPYGVRWWRRPIINRPGSSEIIHTNGKTDLGQILRGGRVVVEHEIMAVSLADLGVYPTREAAEEAAAAAYAADNNQFTIWRNGRLVVVNR